MLVARASVAKVSKWEAGEEVILDEDGNVMQTSETMEVDSSSEDMSTFNENTEDNNEDNCEK